MFLHGGAAHADWWSFIAPFFARTIASSPRPSLAWAARTGAKLMSSSSSCARRARRDGPAAHSRPGSRSWSGIRSAGGRRWVCRAISARSSRAAVMVDPPFFAPQNQRPPSPPRPSRARRVQHSLAALVARFRLMPPQPCDNLFILDFIARRSAREALDHDGRPGWASPSIRISGRSSPGSTPSRSSPPRTARSRSSAARSRSSSSQPTPTTS